MITAEMAAAESPSISSTYCLGWGGGYDTAAGRLCRKPTCTSEVDYFDIGSRMSVAGNVKGGGSYTAIINRSAGSRVVSTERRLMPLVGLFCGGYIVKG